MAQVEPVLILDDRLKFESSPYPFGVFESSQNTTLYSYTSQAVGSLSSQTIVCILPQETTIINKRMRLQTEFTIDVTFANPQASKSLFQWGYDTALCAWPVQYGLIDQTVMQLNGNSSTVQNNQVMPYFIKALDSRVDEFYYGNTTSYPDQSLYYEDLVGGLQNPLGDYANIVVQEAKKVKPRGASVCFVGCVKKGTAGGVVDGQYNGIVQPASITDTTPTLTLKFRVEEPLVVSPLQFHEVEGMGKGMYGVTNLSFIWNLNNGSRVIRSALNYLQRNTAGAQVASTNNTGAYITNTVLSSITQWNLFVECLTPKPTTILPALNSHPYIEYKTFPSNGSIQNVTKVGDLFSITTSTMNLTAIPDKLIIYAPIEPYNNCTAGTTDSFYVIDSINIIFNNSAGILSTMKQFDLFRMSAKSTGQTWEEFSGVGLKKGSSTTAPSQLRTVGSILALDFVSDIPLPEAYLSSGVQGQFSLVMTINFRYPFDSAKTPAGVTNPSTLEVRIITQTSGICSVQSGTCAFGLAPLSRSAILDVASRKSEHVFRSDLRLVGSGMSGGSALFDTVKSFLGPIAMPIAKKFAGFVKDKFKERGERGSDVDKMLYKGMDALGLGKK